MFFSRAVRLSSFLIGGLALLAPGLAHATTPSLVIDVDSGRVLHAERATDPWHPASVTKLMTTYVALEMVRNGRASLDQLLTVSPEAASQPPSKMGFKPGVQLTLDNAIKIIMVKSANDIAAAIAENLGGSIEGFSDLMNDASRRLGMRESRWFNPHGLPDMRQQTSARDMAVLGRAILRDFPEHKDLFSLSAIQFGRRVMRNHNQLIGRYDGIDGMKTGFICSSGFNVVASGTRNGRRLITVVFGSTKAKERTLKAADLFDRGFATSGWFGPSVDELPASALVAAPDMRPVICGRGGPIPGEEDQATEAVSAALGLQADTGSASSTAVSSTALGFAAAATAPGAAWRTRELPPRAPLQPVLVWLGRDPAGAAVVAGDEGEEKPVVKAPARPRVARVPAPKKPDAPVAAAVPAAPKPAAAKAPVKPAVKQAAKPAEVVAPAAKASAAKATPAAVEAKPKPAKKPLAKIAADKVAAEKPAEKKAAAKPKAE